MAKSRHLYELSTEADKDLEDIFDYTAEKFGFEQAVTYISSFGELFELLANNPNLGRKREEIRDGLHSISKESHVIFYRIIRSKVRIVRILHASRDIIRFI